MEIVRQPKSKIRTTDVLRLAAIARDFYLDGKSKIDIAESYGISRFKVARLLEEARESLGAATEREAVEMALDLVGFRKELVLGARALRRLALSRID